MNAAQIHLLVNSSSCYHPDDRGPDPRYWSLAWVLRPPKNGTLAFDFL